MSAYVVPFKDKFRHYYGIKHYVVDVRNAPHDYDINIICNINAIRKTSEHIQCTSLIPTDDTIVLHQGRQLLEVNA